MLRSTWSKILARLSAISNGRDGNTSARRRSVALRCETLEDRVLLHGGEHLHAFPLALITQRELPAAGQLSGALLPLTSIPALSSKPGAPATLYLDFNGHVEAEWGEWNNVRTPVFDKDNNPTTFSDAEIATMREVWQRVAEDYAPFNLNVTTVQPASFADGVALRVAIGGSYSDWFGSPAGGVAYIDTFTNGVPNTVYVFSKNLSNGYARDIAEASSHEAGHGFGLDHQSSYDSSGRKTAEYNPGNSVKAPIMGNSYSAARSLWWRGPSSESATTIQDDMSVIARAENGFGYRADDHGNSADSATPLQQTGSQVAGSGIIAQTTDVDYFAFNTGAGSVTLRVNVASVGANLDAKLELRSATGALIASAAPTDSLNATITATVATGSYRLVVLSQGVYGDVGQYTVSGTVVGLTGPTTPEPLVATVVSSSQVNLSWTNSTGETGFRVYRRLGTNTELIATLAADTTTYTVTGLTAGTTYAFAVEAFNANAATLSAYKTVTTLTRPVPTSPDPLTATAVSNTQINLTWNNSTGEDGYRVYRKSGTTWVLLATLNADVTTYQAAGLAASTAYTFLVSAFNAEGVTNSLAKTATTLATKPSSPEPFTATAVSSSQIKLAWANTVNEDGYRVYRKSGTTWVLLATLNADVTTYQATSLAASTAYTFLVSAYNTAGATNSLAKSATTLTAKPTSPEPLVATATSSSTVRLSWKDAIGEVGYRIYSWTGTVWQLQTSVAADTTSHEITDLSPATTYYYYVAAYNSFGTTSTAWKAVTTQVGPPTSPEPLVARAVSSSQIALSWKNSVGEKGYRVYSWTGSGWELKATLAANVTTYTVTSLAAGTSYYHYVEAFNDSGVVDSTWKGATTFVTAPGPLSGTAVSPTQIDLTWANVAGETGYRVYRKVGTTNQLLSILNADVTSYSVTGLAAGSTHTFYVEAYDTASRAATPLRTVTTLTGLPSTPEPLVVQALSSAEIRLSWTDVIGEDGYRIYRWSGTAWQSLANLAAGTTQYTLSDLLPATAHSFYVEAFNSLGSVKTASKSATTYVAAPEPLVATALSASQVRLSWSNVVGETGYRLHRWTGSAWQVLATVGANVTSYTVTGLAADTTYYYYAEAYSGAGASATDWVEVQTWESAPDVPAWLEATAISNTAVVLEWADSVREDGYRVYRWTGYDWDLLRSVAADVTSTEVSELMGGTTYYYYVAAYNTSGVSGTPWVEATTFLDAPEPLVAVALSATQVWLDWSDVVGESGYRVYDWNGTDWVLLTTLNANVSSYTVTGLTGGRTYYYYVEAFNGGSRAHTDWQEVTTA